MTHEERYHYNGRCYAGLPETNSIPVSECTNGRAVVFSVGVIDGFEVDYIGYGGFYSRYTVVVRFDGERRRFPISFEVYQQLCERAKTDPEFYTRYVKMYF